MYKIAFISMVQAGVDLFKQASPEKDTEGDHE